MADDFQEKEPISIHSARVGGDGINVVLTRTADISIHSARVGGDLCRSRCSRACGNFNPLRPCGRRRAPKAALLCRCRYFNPLRPCGRRRGILFAGNAHGDYFNPLRPCGRRPYALCGFSDTIPNFNPLRPCGRRQQKKPFFRLLSISITTYFTEKSKRTRCKFSHLGYLFQYSLLILVRTSLYVDV